MYRKSSMVVWIIATLFISCPLVFAQSIWLNNSDKGHFGLELLRPAIKGTSDLSAKLYYLSLNTANSDKGGIAIDIPYVHYEDSYYGYYYDDVQKNDAIGNPYIGFQSAMLKSQTFYEVGARLPFASDKKGPVLVMGYFTDLDRVEAYLAKYLTIQATFNRCWNINDGLSARLRIAPSFLFYTGDESDLGGDFDKTEVFIHYSGQLFYKLKDLTIRTGITGIAALSQENLVTPDGYFAHQLNLAFDYRIGWVRPGFIIRLPLDGYLYSTLNSVIGLNVRVDLN